MQIILDPGFPNGATRQAGGLPPCKWGERGELKHLSTRRRRKQNVIPQVVASERGTAQTGVVSAAPGLGTTPWQDGRTAEGVGKRRQRR